MTKFFLLPSLFSREREREIEEAFSLQFLLFLIPDNYWVIIFFRKRKEETVYTRHCSSGGASGAEEQEEEVEVEGEKKTSAATLFSRKENKDEDRIDLVRVVSALLFFGVFAQRTRKCHNPL